MGLSVTRKINESIKLGEHITVRVSNLSHSKVTLTIDAPVDVVVLRSELIAKPRRSVRKTVTHTLNDLLSRLIK